MSQESSSWLNLNTLIGYTDQRGQAWHYRAEAQGTESNHYPGAIPVEDVRRRLFPWEAVEGAITAVHVRDDGDVLIHTSNNRKAIMRSDTGEILGVFKDSYLIHQYPEWLLDTAALLIDDELQIGSAGLLRNGGQAWVQLEVPDTITTPEGVAFRPHLLCATSLDGTLSTVYRRCVTNVVCHAEGTRIIDGAWRGAVEDHPSATRSYRRHGFAVTVKGLPFAEQVTEEHRYYARQRRRNLTAKRQAEQEAGGTATLTRSKVGQNADAGWVEARDLVPMAHEIGYPIDTTERPAVGIPHMHDPEWLWLIGYWWGDGHLNRAAGSVTLTVADTQPEIAARIKEIVPRHSVAQKPGCQQITFYDRQLVEMLTEWYGAVGKTPQPWIELLPLHLQRALVQGYYAADGNVDTTEGCILVSIGLDGLLALRRILARLGIPASIRKGSDPALRSVIQGRHVNAKDQYSIRFWRNCKQLGFTSRFQGVKNSHPYIEDGYVWNRVESVTPTMVLAWPITTDDHTYLTAFGRSHNCDNTMAAALGERGNEVRIRHSRYSTVKLAEAREALAIVHDVGAEFAAQVAALCDVKVSDGDWEQFLATLVPVVTEDGRAKTISDSKREKLNTMWNGDPRVGPWKGTAFGVVQAVNTWTHHEQTIRGGDRAERNMSRAIEGKIDALDNGTLAQLEAVFALDGRELLPA